ncbi:MAG TPA: hypothetical protein VNW52_06540, partial [Burkholderiaceae bacterium]|nr:hypothetical protein [Burkholderiaceae bacterium]
MKTLRWLLFAILAVAPLFTFAADGISNGNVIGTVSGYIDASGNFHAQNAGNPAAGVVGSPVPLSADYLGFKDLSGNTLGVSAANPLPVSGTFSPAGNATTNITQFGGVAVSTGTGISGVGIPRVTVSSDSFPAIQSISAASLPLPAGAATAANQTAMIAALNAGAITPGPALISNATGTGPSSAATPRVTVASDSFPATQAVSVTQLPATLGQAPAANSLPVVLPASVILTGPAAQSAVSTDLLTGNATSSATSWTDASSFQFVAIQLEGSVGITGGNVTFEQTNDPTNALAGQTAAVFSSSGTSGGAFSGSALTVAPSSIASYNMPIFERYIRVRINSAFIGGTVQAVAKFSTFAPT